MKPHSAIFKKLDSIDDKLDKMIEEVRKWQRKENLQARC